MRVGKGSRKNTVRETKEMIKDTKGAACVNDCHYERSVDTLY